MKKQSIEIKKNVQSDSFQEEIKNELTEIKNSIKNIELRMQKMPTEKNLRGLIEIQQRLVHERLGVAVPISPKEYGEESNSKTTLKIDISNLGDDRIKVSGKTFDYKDAIKEAGSAKFDQVSKSWSLPLDSLNQLIKNFEAVNLVRDTDFSVNVDGENSEKQNEEEEDGFGSGF